jgi:hypothetical protein
VDWWELPVPLGESGRNSSSAGIPANQGGVFGRRSFSFRSHPFVAKTFAERNKIDRAVEFS